MSGETKSLGQKDKFDRFYTKREVAKSCVDFFLEKVGKDFNFIEPAAGKGSFLEWLPNYKAYDICPMSPNIIEQDWFTLDKSEFKGKNVVIGNPPFGVQAKKAITFFNTSSFADYIAFIVPKSFKKNSIQNRLNLNFFLIGEMDLKPDSFDFEGETYNVNCVFQIWKKEPKMREKVKRKLTSRFFEFTKDRDEADCSLRRVGAAAGKASLSKNYSGQSNYFLVNRTELSNEEFVDFLNTLTYEGIKNTVGVKSLSKAEFIEEFEFRFLEYRPYADKALNECVPAQK